MYDGFVISVIVNNLSATAHATDEKIRIMMMIMMDDDDDDEK